MTNENKKQGTFNPFSKKYILSCIVLGAIGNALYSHVEEQARIPDADIRRIFTDVVENPQNYHMYTVGIDNETSIVSVTPTDTANTQAFRLTRDIDALNDDDYILELSNGDNPSQIKTIWVDDLQDKAENIHSIADIRASYIEQAHKLIDAGGYNRKQGAFSKNVDVEDVSCKKAEKKTETSMQKPLYDIYDCSINYKISWSSDVLVDAGVPREARDQLFAKKSDNFTVHVEEKRDQKPLFTLEFPLLSNEFECNVQNQSRRMVPVDQQNNANIYRALEKHLELGKK